MQVHLDEPQVLRLVRAFLAEAGQNDAAARVVVPEPPAEDEPRLQALLMKGRWEQVEELLLNGAGDASATALWAVRKERFLEASNKIAVSGKSSEADAAQLSALLQAAEQVAPSRVAYEGIAFVLTLPSIHEHPDYPDWSPWAGRQAA